MRMFLPTLVILMGTTTLLQAQERAEHLYQFAVQALNTPSSEKVFTELILALTRT